jgi:hypothetical protein
MRTAVQMEQLAEARPGLAPPPVPPARPMLLDQARRLQGLLQKAIRHGDAVLAPRNLVKVPDIKAAIPLPVEPEQPLDLGRRTDGDCRRLSTRPT